MSATALFLSSCRRHISRTRLSSSSRSRTSSHGSSASPASRDRRAFSTPASRCALSCALMHAAASRWNASCFRYSRSHSRSPRAIKSSTSVDAHTAATPSATTASDAPTRTTGGRYALAPSSCVNPRTKTRSSRLSTAAFELAQTKMRGLVRPNTRSRPRRSRASRASDAYSSVTVVAALRPPEPPPPLSSAWSASNPDAHRAVSSAASFAETSSGKKVPSSSASRPRSACSTMARCSADWYRANRTMCRTFRIPQTVCVFPVPGGPWTSVNGDAGVLRRLSTSGPLSAAFVPPPPSPAASLPPRRPWVARAHARLVCAADRGWRRAAGR